MADLADLARLRPSTAPPIPLEVLRELPVGGVYLYDAPSSSPVQIIEWGGAEEIAVWEYCDLLPGGRHPITIFLASRFEWRYPKLPSMIFAKTVDQISTPGDQPSGRQKSVTRRRRLPPGIRQGALFLAWDRSHRQGRGKARGLGVFRVNSAYQIMRYACSGCLNWREKHGHRRPLAPERHPLSLDWWCPECGTIDIGDFDTLMPHELALEGFPETDPDDFWAMLVKIGAVGDSGLTWRIAFEAVS